MDGAEGVGDVAHGDDFYAVGPAVGFEGLQEVQVEGCIGEQGDKDEFGAFAGGGLLPWNEVGVVFEAAGQDGVSGAQQEFGEREGGQVKAFGGAAGKDNFPRVGGVDESADGSAGVLEGFG